MKIFVGVWLVRKLQQLDGGGGLKLLATSGNSKE